MGATTVADIRLGQYVCGSTVRTEDLRGRVVLFEFWGVTCPPCIASIPHLAALQEQYGRDDFLLIANHRSLAPTIEAVWTRARGGMLAAVISQGDITGVQVDSTPRCLLFDHRGNMVFDGLPSGVDRALEAAMQATPGFLVADREWPQLAKEARVLGSLRHPLAPLLKILRRIPDGSAAREEAVALLERTEGHAERQLSAIRSLREADPLAAVAILERMRGLMMGDELDRPFAQINEEMRKDPGFQRELQAANALSLVQVQAEKAGFTANPPTTRKRQQTLSFLAALESIEVRFGGTAAAKRAAMLASKWGG